MSTTITIRTDESLRAALTERAEAQGRTVSELVREILFEALRERSMEARAGRLKGRLRLAGTDDDAWRRRLRERNWRS
jgi:hypothetical protein